MRLNIVGRRRTCVGGVSLVGCLGGKGVWWRGRRAYSPSVSNTPSYHTPGIAFGTNLQGEDLGGVEPGNGKPGGAEAGGEDEGEGSGGGAVLGCVGGVVECGS